MDYRIIVDQTRDGGRADRQSIAISTTISNICACSCDWLNSSQYCCIRFGRAKSVHVVFKITALRTIFLEFFNGKQEQAGTVLNRKDMDVSSKGHTTIAELLCTSNYTKV